MSGLNPTKYTLSFVKDELQAMQSELLLDEELVFINQLFIKRSYSKQRFSEWKRDFESDSYVSDAIKRIEDILESRLVTGGLKNKLNPTMVIFTLKNKYSWHNNENEIAKVSFTDHIRFDAKKYMID